MKIYFLKEFLIEQQIKNIDYETNEEVYNIYSIIEAEKKIITANLVNGVKEDERRSK